MLLANCLALTVDGVGQRLAHLLHRGNFNLPYTLCADAVFGCQVVQCHATGSIVVDLEPTFFDDAAAAFVQLTKRLGDTVTG